MALMNEIKKRIHSVGEIRKMTKAMALISAIEMRDSREREAISRPFTRHAALTIAELIKRSPELVEKFIQQRKFTETEAYPVHIYLCTGDKGLSGNFNDSILNVAVQLIEDKRKQLEAEGYQNVHFELRFTGKVGRERMKKLGYDVNDDFSFSIANPSYYRSMDLSDQLLDDAKSGAAAEIYFVYCRLDTAISTEPSYTKVLPPDPEGMLWVAQTRHERIDLARQKFDEDFTTATSIRATSQSAAGSGATGTAGSASSVGQSRSGQMQRPSVDASLPFAFEGDEETVINYLVNTYLNALTYGLLTESYASEQLSRMTSMEGATRNADALLLKLTRDRNRYRQMQITTEITEIVSGADAIS